MSDVRGKPYKVKNSFEATPKHKNKTFNYLVETHSSLALFWCESKNIQFQWYDFSHSNTYRARVLLDKVI